MGYLKEVHGMTLVGTVPEDRCQGCGTKHDAEMPHNRESLAYQYKFYDEHGRWPTWKDAMSHCTDGVRKVWTEALTARGIKVEGDAVNETE